MKGVVGPSNQSQKLHLARARKHFRYHLPGLSSLHEIHLAAFSPHLQYLAGW
uniref:Uncharacterized protein n=1 Tax=Arundo donax TaxID=35708 RepID=A0A0A9ANW2_ARUDO